jgi:hypothetical protein
MIRVEGNQERCSVRIELGNKVCIKNLRTEQAEAFIMRIVVGQIRMYINNTRFRYVNNLSRSTPAKWAALERSNYRFYGNITRVAALKNILARDHVQNDLMAILPSTKSRYFKAYSQLVYDLILWANKEKVYNQ